MSFTKQGFNLILQMDKQFNVDNEYWMPIKEYVNYSVSTCGNVRNDNTFKILKACINRVGYYVVSLCCNGKDKKFYNHKLVADSFLNNPKNKRCVDHIDRNKLNNHISNLRFATDSENGMNARKKRSNTSGYIGVCFNKRLRKYMAYYTLNRKRKHIGYYETPEEASFAYQEKIQEHYKEFANM